MDPYSFNENFHNQSMNPYSADSSEGPYSSQMIPTQFGIPGPPPFGGPSEPPFGGPNRPPFGGPGAPPFGGPNRPPFGGPGAPPFGGPNQPPSEGPGAPPPGPPPSFTPMMSYSQSGSSGIRQCIYRNTFIWLRGGDSFWFFPTFVSRNVILGFRWGRFGWVFSTINRDNILTFQCF